MYFIIVELNSGAWRSLESYFVYAVKIQSQKQYKTAETEATIQKPRGYYPNQKSGKTSKQSENWTIFFLYQVVY